MDDTAESIAKQKEIDELLSGQLTKEDEEEVLRELEQLEELDKLAAEGENVRDKLPEVPTHELPGKKSILRKAMYVFIVLVTKQTHPCRFFVTKQY